MLHLFIDSNVYLNCYHFSGDDLEELKKLSLAVTRGDIRLYTTQQVIDEFTRNREAKIFDALRQFKDKPVPREFPQIVKNTPEYEEMQAIARDYSSKMKDVSERLEQDITNKTTAADQAINAIFNSASKLGMDEDIVKAAQLRSAVGNPPGKKDSLGDAINWELLLGASHNSEEFFIVSADKDYASDYDPTRISQFLNEEWRTKHASQLSLYDRLSGFFKDHFPDINLAEDFEKQLAIQSLINSGSFMSTHKAISELNKYADFTDDEIRDLVNAAINNSQVGWIIADDDVKEFYERILAGKESVLEEQELKNFDKLTNEDEYQFDEVDLSDITF